MDTIIPQKRCFKCKQTKPLTEFHKASRRSDGHRAECKQCSSNYDKTRVRTNTSTMGMRAAGLSRKDYMEHVEAQNGKCAICGKEETSLCRWGTVKNLAVDHDHVTGKFRGLLCQLCNTRLAVLEDVEFVSSALKYLKKHDKLPHEWPEGGRLL